MKITNFWSFIFEKNDLQHMFLNLSDLIVFFKSRQKLSPIWPAAQCVVQWTRIFRHS